MTSLYTLQHFTRIHSKRFMFADKMMCKRYHKHKLLGGGENVSCDLYLYFTFTFIISGQLLKEQPEIRVK